MQKILSYSNIQEVMVTAKYAAFRDAWKNIRFIDNLVDLISDSDHRPDLVNVSCQEGKVFIV